MRFLHAFLRMAEVCPDGKFAVVTTEEGSHRIDERILPDNVGVVVLNKGEIRIDNNAVWVDEEV